MVKKISRKTSYRLQYTLAVDFDLTTYTDNHELSANPGKSVSASNHEENFKEMYSGHKNAENSAKVKVVGPRVVIPQIYSKY